MAEVVCFLPFTTTSGIAIGELVESVRVGLDVSAGMAGRSERTDIQH